MQGLSLRPLLSVSLRWGYDAVSPTGLLPRWQRRRSELPTVLTYHGVVSDDLAVALPYDANFVTASLFRKHLELLQRRYRILEPAEFLSWMEGNTRIDSGGVLLTCDDGLRNNATVMLPILEEANARCLFFVTGESASDDPKPLWLDELRALLGTDATHDLWWQVVKLLSRVDGQTRSALLNELAEKCGLATSSAVPEHRHPMGIHELRTLVSRGMTIGAHSLTHTVLALQPEAEARAEIEASRRLIETVIDVPVWAFAYPFGTLDSITERDVSVVHDAGYRVAFMNEPASAFDDRYLLPRCNIGWGTRTGSLDAAVSGFHLALQRRLGAVV